MSEDIIHVNIRLSRTKPMALNKEFAIVGETTLITSDNCVRNLEVKLYNPIDNIILIELLLANSTTESNISVNLIPKLHFSELIHNCMLMDEDNVLHLKDVLKTNRSQYYHTTINTLTRLGILTKSFSFFKCHNHIKNLVCI